MSDANNLTIQVAADTSKLRVDLAKAQDEVKQLGAALRGAAKEANETGDDIGLRHIAAEYDGAVAKVAALRREVAAASTASIEHAKVMSGEFGVAARVVEQLGGNFGRIKESLAPAGEAVKGLTGHFGDLRNAVNRLIDRTFPRLRQVMTLTAAGAAGEIVHLVDKANEDVLSFRNQATALGLTPEDWDKVLLAFSKHGVAAEQATTLMSRFVRVMGEAREEARKAAGEPLTGSGPVEIVRGQVGTPASGAGVQAGVDVLKGGLQDMSGAATNGVTVLNGLHNSAVNLAKPFQVLGIDVRRFAGNSKGTIEALEAAANAIDHMSDRAVASRTAEQLFNRTWHRAAPVLKDLKQALQGAGAEIAKFHSGRTQGDLDQAQAFENAKAQFAREIQRSKEIIGVGLGRGFIPAFDEIRRQLEQSSVAIRQWADRNGKYLGEIAKDFGDLFKGVQLGAPGQPQFRTDFAQNFLKAKDAIVGAIDEIKGAYQTVKPILASIANGINSLFGTKLTAGSVAVLAAITSMTGAFTFLATAITAASAAAAFFLATPLGLTLTFIGLIALEVYQHWDQVKAGFQALWEKAKEVGAWARDTFGPSWQTVSDTVAGAWHTVIDGIEAGIHKVVGWFDAIAERARSIAHAIGSFFGGGSSPSPPPPAEGHARGGYIRGPGTGTSDSIPALLSDREFVVSARATAQPGVLPFLHDLNTIGSHAAAAVRGFAAGGLVTLGSIAAVAVPALAAGGLVEAVPLRTAHDYSVPQHFASGGLAQAPAAAGGGRALHTINLTIGNETVRGLLAP